ncbi:hypothetical protein VNO77_34045 [Canavalia gladiata]|uniref:Uncharacterized protein n=1 Tax=Canavalia gladiata TaxID=3824 RepID=A0AAN9KDK9_CANGL
MRLHKYFHLLAKTRGSRLLAVEGSGLYARNIEEHHGYRSKAQRNSEKSDFRESVCASMKPMSRLTKGCGSGSRRDPGVDGRHADGGARRSPPLASWLLRLTFASGNSFNLDALREKVWLTCMRAVLFRFSSKPHLNAVLPPFLFLPESLEKTEQIRFGGEPNAVFCVLLADT